MILAIKTDQQEAEVYLVDVDGGVAAQKKWQAHRELEITILSEIEELLSQVQKKVKSHARHARQAGKKEKVELQGIVTFAGPGSFTGLRIGFTVTNALAWAKGIPNVSSSGEEWIKDGIAKLATQKTSQILTPEYGSEPNITMPKK